jgi:hypothetical protein
MSRLRKGASHTPLPPEDADTIRTIAREKIAAAELRVAAAVTTAQDRTIEALRNARSEIVRGIEAFARVNFARMVYLETADASTTQRLAAIEERLLALETQQHLNQSRRTVLQYSAVKESYTRYKRRCTTPSSVTRDLTCQPFRV